MLAAPNFISDPAGVVIIGGGLAGLAAALDLAGRGHQVVVIERKQYPFHKVCGEYVSREVLPYLRRLGADPAPLGPATISRFRLSSPAGRTCVAVAHWHPREVGVRLRPCGGRLSWPRTCDGDACNGSVKQCGDLVRR